MTIITRDTVITISFPDLSPAMASITAQALVAQLIEDGTPQCNVSRVRPDATQDLGGVIEIINPTASRLALSC